MQTTGFYFGVFTLTGLWFWSFLFAWVIVTFVDIHKERPGWASFWLVFLLVGLHLGGIVDVIDIVWNHSWKVLGGFSTYIGVGFIWTILKFKMWLRDHRIFINDNIMAPMRRQFLIDNKFNEDLEQIPEHLQGSWKQKKNHSEALRSAMRLMEVYENKSRLMMWAIWWPISMIWTLVSDWVTKLFNYVIFDVLGGLLGRIVNSEKAKISLD